MRYQCTNLFYHCGCKRVLESETSAFVLRLSTQVAMNGAIEKAKALRHAAFKLKMKEVEDTGADSLVTSCDSCRYNFITGGESAHWDKNIESLVELVADNLAD